MRILDHASPVTTLLPDYPGKRGRILPLTPGSLFTKRDKKGKRVKPWSYSLELRRYGVWDKFLKNSSP